MPCKSGWRDLRLGGGRGEGRSCIKLTLSGTQENFSEIIKGTPSIAAKEEKKKMALKVLKMAFSCPATEDVETENMNPSLDGVR